jgi:hypothetical protein
MTPGLSSAGRRGPVGKADEGLLPCRDEGSFLVLDGEDLQPTHGQRAPGFQHHTLGLQVLPAGRAIRLILYSTESTEVLAGKQVSAA